MKAKPTITRSTIEILIASAYNDIANLDDSKYTRKVQRAIERAQRAMDAALDAKLTKRIKQMRTS